MTALEEVFSSAPIRSGFEKLLQDYVAGLPGERIALAEAIADQKAAEVESRLHRLAGSLGLYGFEQAEQSFRSVLHDLRHGTPLAELQPRLQELTELLGRIQARP